MCTKTTTTHPVDGIHFQIGCRPYAVHSPPQWRDFVNNVHFHLLPRPERSRINHGSSTLAASPQTLGGNNARTSHTYTQLWLQTYNSLHIIHNPVSAFIYISTPVERSPLRETLPLLFEEHKHPCTKSPPNGVSHKWRRRHGARWRADEWNREHVRALLASRTRHSADAMCDVSGDTTGVNVASWN